MSLSYVIPLVLAVVFFGLVSVAVRFARRNRINPQQGRRQSGVPAGFTRRLTVSPNWHTNIAQRITNAGSKVLFPLPGSNMSTEARFALEPNGPIALKVAYDPNTRYGHFVPVGNLTSSQRQQIQSELRRILRSDFLGLD